MVPWAEGAGYFISQRDADYPDRLVQHRPTRTHAAVELEEAPETAIIQAETWRQTMAVGEFVREREEREQKRDIQAVGSLRGSRIGSLVC